MRLLIVALSMVAAAGCASSSPTYVLPESDADSNAPGEAFTGAGMYLRKPIPDRRDWKPWEFYYKHCAMTGDESYFSRTAYECSGPYY